MQTEWAIVMHRVPPGDAYAASPNVRFGSKADMCSAKGHVRFTPKSGHVQCTADVRYVPIADIGTNQFLFDHLVGASEQRRRHGEAERLGGLKINDQLEFGRLFNRQITRLCTF